MERYEWRLADDLECTVNRLRRDVELGRIRFEQRKEGETKDDNPIVIQKSVIA